MVSLIHTLSDKILLQVSRGVVQCEFRSLVLNLYALPLFLSFCKLTAGLVHVRSMCAPMGFLKLDCRHGYGSSVHSYAYV